MNTMRMTSSLDIRPRPMQLPMNMHTRSINRSPGPDFRQHKALLIHTNQITPSNLREVQPVRVNPHPLWIHRITKTDMPGGAFAETELAEESEGAGHVFEAPGTLGQGGCEGRLQGHVDCTCAVADGEGVH